MKLLTAGGLLFGAVHTYSLNDSTEVNGNEGEYELFDYTLTITAGPVPLKSARVTAASSTIGYNPVATTIVITNDGGKIIVGYGMQTKTIAVGFAISYMSQSSNINCTGTGVSNILGYNVLVPKNFAGETTTPITNPADCATTSTWTYQASIDTDLNCLAVTCVGISQPFFGIAEDWAHGDVLTTAGTSISEFYLVGAIELPQVPNMEDGSSAAQTASASVATFGNGAYEVRVMKLNVSGTMVWDNGGDDIAATGATTTIRSNCVIPEVISLMTKTPAECVRNAGHSAFLTARLSDNVVQGVLGAWTNNVRYLIIGGVGISGQSPLMYKNGWQFTLGQPLLYRLQLTLPDQTMAAAEFTTGGPLPSTKDAAPSATYTPGAYTKIILDLSHTKTGADGPATYAIKPGTVNTTSAYFAGGTGDVSNDANAGWGTKTTEVTFTVADQGTIIDCHGFKSDGGHLPDLEAIDSFMCVGSMDGAGFIQTMTIAAPGTDVPTGTTNNTSFVAIGYDKLIIPSGGIVNFKGVNTTPTYVNQECFSIAPHLNQINATDLVANTRIDGWVFQCRNGIGSCTQIVNEASIPPPPISALTPSSETDACYADQRYMNYRIQTFYYTNASLTESWSSLSWSRQDSYYESTATAYTNTASTGVVLDLSLELRLNNGPTNTPDNERTYVFGLYNEIDGIQINHFGTDGDNISPTTNMVPGSGTNNLTSDPIVYSSTNWCIGTNLKLEGTTSYMTLDAAILAYSDGYKATSTLNLEQFMGGASNGWKGYCMVYHSALFTMDNTNGSVCHVAQQNSDHMIDFSQQYVMHVPQATWAPPNKSASVTPSGNALTDAKYGISYDPVSATSNVFQTGYYASASWYQPKAAETYSSLRRYGAGDYVSAYCIYGVGSTSYFNAPTAATETTTLLGAVALTTSAVVLGSSYLVM